MKGYLDWTAHWIRNWCKEDSVVITTGGFTDPLEKNSEAEMMAAYLREKFRPYCPSIQIVTEEEATTTNENLRNTGKLMNKYNLVGTNDLMLQVLVFCDKLRKRKVDFLSKKLLLRSPMSYVLVHGYEGFSHSFFEKRILQPFKTIVDILGYYLPVIEQMEVRIRKVRRDKKAKEQKIMQKM